jgi:hypothetical protein
VCNIDDDNIAKYFKNNISNLLDKIQHEMLHSNKVKYVAFNITWSISQDNCNVVTGLPSQRPFNSSDIVCDTYMIRYITKKSSSLFYFVTELIVETKI